VALMGGGAAGTAPLKPPDEPARIDTPQIAARWLASHA